MVNHYAVTEDMPGGTRHLDIAKLLKAHGWNTHIFASAFNHNSHKFERRGRLPWTISREVVEGVEFVWIPTTPYTGNNWRRYLNMLVYSIQVCIRIPFGPKPRVVLGSSGHLLAGLVAYIASRVYRVPFVLEIRDVWPDSLIQLGLNNRFIIRVLQWMERFLYEQASLIIAVSQGIADRIVEKGVTTSKIEVLSHGVMETPPPSISERERARAELGWQDKVVAIWAGSLQPFNGLDVVVEAARQLQDQANLLIVFVGDGSERDSLMEQAKGLGNVVFHPAVPKSEIRKWLVASDIGILNARRFEAFLGTRPRKIFDYFSVGLAIVCTIPGEAWDVIRDADAGVFAEWEDPNALASALRHLACDADLRRRLGDNGRHSLVEKHSLGRMTEQFAASLMRISTPIYEQRLNES